MPSAVQATLKREAMGAKITTVDIEKLDGKLVYEADAVIEGSNYEIIVMPNGKLLSKKLDAEPEKPEGKSTKAGKEEKDGDKPEGKSAKGEKEDGVKKAKGAKAENDDEKPKAKKVKAEEDDEKPKAKKAKADDEDEKPSKVKKSKDEHED